MSHTRHEAWAIIILLSALGCGESGQGGAEQPLGAAGTGSLAGASGGSVTTAGSGGTSGAGASAAGQGGTGSGGESAEAGTGGAIAAGGSGGSAGGGTAGTMMADAAVEDAGSGEEPCVKGTVDGSQLIFIGDSFLAAPTSNIAFELEALMMASGSSAYSEAPRFRQLVGTTMEQIVAQYDTEHELDPDIKVVIANGGGNDVLVTDRSCLLEAPPANTGCAATVENALEHARALMAKAQAHGVEHIVYFFYPHEPTTGLFQGDAPAINDSLDYAEPMARAICESSPICTFVSLSEAAGDTPGSGYVDRGYHDLDGTHPSPAGSKFFAEAIWSEMVEHCIAQ
jgi:lysophospholipase L1-like esterase